MPSTTTRILTAAVAMLVLATPAATAKPIGGDRAALAQERYYSSYGSGGGEPATDLRSPDTRDAAAGRGTFNAPEIAVVRLPQPAPVADDGIDWGDVAIGAGGAAGLALLAAGGTFAIARRRQGTRLRVTTG